MGRSLSHIQVDQSDWFSQVRLRRHASLFSSSSSLCLQLGAVTFHSRASRLFIRKGSRLVMKYMEDHAETFFPSLKIVFLSRPVIAKLQNAAAHLKTRKVSRASSDLNKQAFVCLINLFLFGKISCITAPRSCNWDFTREYFCQLSWSSHVLLLHVWVTSWLPLSQHAAQHC